MTSILDTSALHDLLPVPKETWIVMWTHPADPTGRPYWTGTAKVNPSHDDQWSDRRRDAMTYPSRAAALEDDELADFWDSGDIEAVLVVNLGA
jgi:hypothetical protein